MIATITPPPAAAITRCAAWAANMKPFAVESSAVSQSASSTSAGSRGSNPPDGQWTYTSSPPNVSAAASTIAAISAGSGRVGPDDARPAAERLDVGPRLLGRAGGAVVAHEHVRAALRQVECERPADAVRAAGDEDPAAVDGGHVGIC